MINSGLRRYFILSLRSYSSCATSRGEKAFTEVQQFFKKHGNDEYIGEPISQEEHALQSANLASKCGVDDDTILAALLHDIGHIYGLSATKERMGDCGVANHEKLGADYLRSLGFSEKCSELVERHVDAKRYLCCVNKDYHDKLSEASKTTLMYQGGPMTEEEAARFEVDPLYKTIILMRKWDEAAKVPNKAVPTLEDYRSLMVNHVAKQAEI